jgi:hypothetical protein
MEKSTVRLLNTRVRMMTRGRNISQTYNWYGQNRIFFMDLLKPGGFNPAYRRV